MVNSTTSCSCCGSGGQIITTRPITRIASIYGTGNSILFQANINASNRIVSSSYSIGGLHGTITQIGVLEQQPPVNCVTSFKMYLSGTWSYTIGTSIYYTSNVVIYGNIYQGQMAIGGMVYEPIPYD